MSLKVDPNLMKELKHYGLKDAGKCYHCGNCTGVCPLSTPENSFPRRMVKYAQMGLTEQIKASPEPWMCYYCGDCSEKCPRGAQPGETMMALRRWLTAQYDFTGIAKRFYTSEAFEVGAIVGLGLLIMFLFLAFGGPVVTDKVALNTYAPNWVIEILDWIMGACLSAVLLINVFRCARMVMKGKPFLSQSSEGILIFGIPIKYYFQRVKDGIVDMVTQRPFKHCSDRFAWVIHLLIFTGYTSIFIMVVVFLRWFQRDAMIDPEWPIVSVIMTIVGYYATAALLFATTYALIGRLKKTKWAYKNSHATDWVFLILLSLTTSTGILVHITIAFESPMATYVIYVFHLMVAIPMLVLEVPFAKWAHLAYRPTVLFLKRVERDYQGKKQPYEDTPEPIRMGPEAMVEGATMVHNKAA